MLIVLSCAIPYLFGLGLITTSIFPALFKAMPATKQEVARLLAFLLVAGMALNYAIVLIFEDIRASLLVCSVLSLSGFLLAARAFGKRIPKYFRIGWGIGGATIYLSVLFSLSILLLPLVAWDARSIWFFHGKIIYYNNALDVYSGWNNYANKIPHADYPKLVPVMAAQIAYVAGYWNEYLPKASLLALLIPALLGVFSFFDRIRISLFYLVAMVFFVGGCTMWDGYMDGYLALYAGLTLLYIGRWVRGDGQPLDLLAGFAFMAIAVNLKNEGMLYAIAVLSSMIVTIFTMKKKPLVDPLIMRWNYWVLLVVPFAGYWLWTWKKLEWGLRNDLKLGTASFFHHIAERVEGGLFSTVGKALFIDSFVARAILVFLLAIEIAIHLRVRLTPPAWLAFLTAFIYFSGIFVIVLSTPQDLIWHLNTTYDRILLTSLVCTFTATFFVLQEIENV